MRLSPKTSAELETFFRQYFDDKSLVLPQVEIYINGGARLITNLIGVDGITIGRHIFIRPGIVKKNEESVLEIGKNLLSHEVTHVIQYQKLGFVRFLYDYLRQYLAGLLKRRKLNANTRLHAYFEISHEVQARLAADRFEDWFAENRHKEREKR